MAALRSGWAVSRFDASAQASRTASWLSTTRLERALDRRRSRTVASDGNTASIVPAISTTGAGAGGAAMRGNSGVTSTGMKPAIAAASISLRRAPAPRARSAARPRPASPAGEAGEPGPPSAGQRHFCGHSYEPRMSDPASSPPSPRRPSCAPLRRPTPRTARPGSADAYPSAPDAARPATSRPAEAGRASPTAGMCAECSPRPSAAGASNPACSGLVSVRPA